MSTAEILSMVSKIAYAAAGVSLVLALFFWFKFNIPSVISDLSGRTARKSIERIRAHNEKQNEKKRPAAPKTAAAKPAVRTEKAKTPSKPVQSKPQASVDDRPETGLLSDNKALSHQAEATAVLSDNMVPNSMTEETAVLSPLTEETSMLSPQIEETSMLSEGTSTSVLDEDATALLVGSDAAPARRVRGKKMTMLDEVILIHTDEVIE